MVFDMRLRAERACAGVAVLRRGHRVRQRAQLLRCVRVHRSLQRWRPGTDPLNPDTDDDGISDGDEALGTPDGLDLPAMGSDPVRRDIFIERDGIDGQTPIDWNGNGVIDDASCDVLRDTNDWASIVWSRLSASVDRDPDPRIIECDNSPIGN